MMISIIISLLIIVPSAIGFQLIPYGVGENEKYLACTKMPHVIFMVNNNSISTSVPDGKYLYVAVTAKTTQIYRYPVRSATKMT